MKISALRLFNVKRFAGRGVAIENIGDGVNVLSAANEYGKSTSFEALHALFFQPHSSTGSDVRNLRPYSGGSPLIEVDVETDTSRLRITKQFYGGRSAQVFDLNAGRLVAQADEAENVIAGLVKGGAGGPAGLLWVRQGVTGLERRTSKEEESEKQVRAGLLESVQGEVEAITGGRRMAKIIAAASEERLTLVTATGKPKAGGRYALAIDDRDRLSADEKRLGAEVVALREALDRRAVIQRRLADLQDADERVTRRQAVETARTAFEAAKAKDERLRAARAELNLARQRHDNADQDRMRFEEALSQAAALYPKFRSAAKRRDEAVGRRRDIAAAIEKARDEAEAAEIEEGAARELLERLDAAEKALDARERLAGLSDRLEQAEAVRQSIEENEANLALVKLPAGAIDELAKLDVEIATVRAMRDAGRPSVTVAYEDGASSRITLAGEPLSDGVERTYDGHACLIAPGFGAITLRSNKPESDGRLETAEEQRTTLLASMGVADLTAARIQQERAEQLEAKARDGRVEMAVLAPEGLGKLREEVAAHARAEAEPLEVEGDPAKIKEALERAGQRRMQASQNARASEQLREGAEDAFARSEAELATLETEAKHLTAILGPEDEREARRSDLINKLIPLKGALEEAENLAGELELVATDIDFAQASLSRAVSVEQAVETEISQLKLERASLNALIGARSDEAVEETWLETRDALAAAEGRVAAYEKEVSVLQRLSGALDSARSQAQELYLKPVVTELKPLLGLLFDDVSITFDEGTLLPQTISRNGLEEEIERLSGGMREQLSVLTRLAFARLLARDGRPAPVILDDALVYSDDDRIEKIFDALHRQSRDQQIIVFSCRQRAFQKLGGNVLGMTEWSGVAS